MKYIFPPILFLTLLFLIYSSFAMSGVEQNRAAASCPKHGDAQIVGAFFHKKNRSSQPDYCEYHLFDVPALTQLVEGVKDKVSESAVADKVNYQVIYKDLSGETFASKALNFSAGLRTPAVEQLDSRSEEYRFAAPSEETGSWDVAYQKKADDEKKTWLVPSEDIHVNDAGFVHKVLGSWDTLMDDETVKFRFLSITHGKSIDMSAMRVKTDMCTLPTPTSKPEDFVCIKVDISNYLIRLVAPALWLSFDKSSRRLEVFKGIVNLRDDRGRNQSGSIYYQYR